MSNAPCLEASVAYFAHNKKGIALNMICVRLTGGLGNQLFQYATALSLASIHNVAVGLDLSALNDLAMKNITPRSFQLSAFKISGTILSPQASAPFRSALENRWRLLLAGLTGTIGRYSYIRERGFAFDEDVLRAPYNSYLDGYWQSHKYFERIKNSVRIELRACPEFNAYEAKLAQQIAQCASVAVHVRRGDYISVKAHLRIYATCDTDYYRRAIELLRSHNPLLKIYVFSDDPLWAHTHLSSSIPAEYVGLNEATGDISEFALMTRCRHHVIANSTFSWWSAWLADHPGQRVIAPKRWFNDRSIPTDDLMPSHWIRI